MEIKALVADSSTKVRKNITRSLKEIGVRNVVEATDTDQAIELVQEGHLRRCLCRMEHPDWRR